MLPGSGCSRYGRAATEQAPNPPPDNPCCLPVICSDLKSPNLLVDAAWRVKVREGAGMGSRSRELLETVPPLPELRSPDPQPNLTHPTPSKTGLRLQPVPPSGGQHAVELRGRHAQPALAGEQKGANWGG